MIYVFLFYCRPIIYEKDSLGRFRLKMYLRLKKVLKKLTAHSEAHREIANLRVNRQLRIIESAW